MSLSNKMTDLFAPGWLCLLLATLLALAGCGGGSGTKIKTAGTGKATLTVIWPPAPTGKNSRKIPADTNSLVVAFTVSDGKGGTIPLDPIPPITRPKSSNTVTVPLTNLPFADLNGTAFAYASSPPQPGEVPLAMASFKLTVTSDPNHNNIPVNLDSEITHFNVEPEDSSFKPETSKLTITQSLKLRPLPTNDAGQIVPVSTTLQWQVVDNPQVLSVDQTGLVNALSAGSATVKVTESDTGKYATVTLTVGNGSVYDIVIDGPSKRRLGVNETLTLSALVRDDTPQHNVISVTGLEWISDNNDIVDVMSDKSGSNTHIVTAGNHAGMAGIHVHDRKSGHDSPVVTILVGTGALQNLSVTTAVPNASNILTVGGSQLTLVATGTDDANLPFSLAPANLTWKSDPGASVVKDPATGNGIVTPTRKGNNIQITVTESTSGKSKSYLVSVLLSVAIPTVDNDHPTLNGVVNCSTSIMGAAPGDTPGVTWDVVDAQGKHLSPGVGGTIADMGTDANGISHAQYTAPTQAGVYYILATSRDDSMQPSPLRAITVQSGTGTITVK